MENPEEILHSLEEFTKLRPKDIPRELEEYLSFVAKTGDPVYQWSVIKTLFREKLINVITEFYESTCLADILDIPPCPNVDRFNYDSMKTFILEKLDTFIAAPFTVQRICELLTSPRKEYNRIDKYMRALEKNILVVSTTEPGNHRVPENGDGFVNGIETEHIQDVNNDINIEEMDDTPAWPTKTQDFFQSTSKNNIATETFHSEESSELPEPDRKVAQPKVESVITCCPSGESTNYVSIEPVETTPIEVKKDENVTEEKNIDGNAVPATLQRRRNSIEPPIENICESIEDKQVEKEKEPTLVEVPSETKNIVTLPLNEPENIIDNEPEEISPITSNTPDTTPVEVEETKSVIADSCTSDSITIEVENLKSNVDEIMEVTNEAIIESVSSETNISPVVNKNEDEESLDIVSNSADSASSSSICEEIIKSESKMIDVKVLDTKNEVEVVVAESTEKEIVEKVIEKVEDFIEEVSAEVQTTEEETITSTCDLIIDIPIEDGTIIESEIVESSNQEAEAKTISSPLPTLTETSENSNYSTPVTTLVSSKEIDVPSEESPMEVDVQDTNTASTETSTLSTTKEN